MYYLTSFDLSTPNRITMHFQNPDNHKRKELRIYGDSAYGEGFTDAELSVVREWIRAQRTRMKKSKHGLALPCLQTLFAKIPDALIRD